MKVKIFLLLIVLFFILIFLNCPDNPAGPENNNNIAVNNNNAGANNNSTDKETQASTAIQNIPDFEIKLPASLAGKNTSAHGRISSRMVLTDLNKGFKSGTYKEFLDMLYGGHTGSIYILHLRTLRGRQII